MTLPRAAVPAHASAQRVGAVSAFIVAAAVIIIAMLAVVLGPVPQSPLELRAWSQAAQFPLALLNEIIVIGAGLLVPVVLALWRAWAARERASVAIGLGLLAAVPLMWTVGLVQGRLVYPIGALEITDPAGLALITALWLGGALMVSFVIAAGLACLGVALVRDGKLRWLGVLGFAAGAAQLLLAYSWLLPPVAGAVLLLPPAAFFSGVGIDLLRAHPATSAAPTRPTSRSLGLDDG